MLLYFTLSDFLRYRPGLHVAENSQVVVVAADSLLNLLNEEAKLHEDDQTRHGQPDVTEDLREEQKGEKKKESTLD